MTAADDAEAHLDQHRLLNLGPGSDPEHLLQLLDAQIAEHAVRMANTNTPNPTTPNGETP